MTHDTGERAGKRSRIVLHKGKAHVLGSSAMGVIRGPGHDGIKRAPRLPDRSKKAA